VLVWETRQVLYHSRVYQDGIRVRMIW